MQISVTKESRNLNKWIKNANLNINHYFTHIHKERKKKPLDPFNNSSLNWLLDPGKSNLVFKSSNLVYYTIKIQNMINMMLLSWG